VNCEVIGFIALDEVLRVFFGGVMSVAFEFHVGHDFLHDDATNSTCFRVPFDMIATLERLGHLPVATERRLRPASDTVMNSPDRSQYSESSASAFAVCPDCQRPRTNSYFFLPI
jgi:hypothetical protein